MNRWRRAAVVAGVLALAITAVAIARGEDGDPLSSLVAAERAFAKMSVDTTQREAFLANFSDEGVLFTPAPVNAKEALRKPAPSPAAATRVLDWDPVTGDVAASGDLGYTTGPWMASERPAGAAPKTTGTGWFFSVWRRTGGAGWKVAADFGVQAPHGRVLRAQPFRRADVRAAVPAATGQAGPWADELRAADAAFGRRLAASGWADALRAGATDDVRAYRDGREPATGRADAAAILPSGPQPFTWEPSFALASAAGDLGYTYGACRARGDGTPIRGYYLRVWKRARDGWKLAVDVANAADRPQR